MTRLGRRLNFSPGRSTVRIVVGILVAGVVLLAARSSLARPYRLGGISDAPSLVTGDLVWINLAAYDLRVPFTGRSVLSHDDPRRGDFVLCDLPGMHEVIKRVVGVGGDVIELRGNRLFINGEAAVYEPLESRHFEDLSNRFRTGDHFAIEQIGDVRHMISYSERGDLRSDFGPIVVPEGEYFLLGDNRANSYDSRSAECGCIARDAIHGRLIGRGRSIPDGGASEGVRSRPNLI